MNNLPQKAEILLYSTDDGTIKIDVLAQDDTLHKKRWQHFLESNVQQSQNI